MIDTREHGRNSSTGLCIAMRRARGNNLIRFPSTIIISISNLGSKFTIYENRSSRSGRRGVDKVSQRNPCQINKKDRISKMIIFTRKIRTMYQPRKMHNVFQEMGRPNVNISRISESRWTTSGCFSTNNGTLYSSGNSGKY